MTAKSLLQTVIKIIQSKLLFYSDLDDWGDVEKKQELAKTNLSFTHFFPEICVGWIVEY